MTNRDGAVLVCCENPHEKMFLISSKHQKNLVHMPKAVIKKRPFWYLNQNLIQLREMKLV